ncbi:hypothetical protein Pelo_617 [Pelomyxa schiedti]|nr:hypothetical protein Pelo_617 [Pelomyxa schiedti]
MDVALLRLLSNAFGSVLPLSQLDQFTNTTQQMPVSKAIPMVIIIKSKSTTEPKIESVLEITPDHPILDLSVQQMQPQQSLQSPHTITTNRGWYLPTTLCEPHITHVDHVYNFVLEPQQ